MPMPSRRAALLSSVLLAAAVALAQSPQPRLTFDVATIHPSPPDARGGMVKPLPNGTGYIVQNMTAKTMMSVMYRIPARQITGGPDWFSTEPFDVQAKTEKSYSLDELHTMFKNLLADRFGLKFHIETKEGPVYDLVVGKSGVKMKAAGSIGDLNIPITPIGPGQFVGVNAPMPYLCWFLGQMVPGDPRPVIDQTGLTQVYDFTLKFAPELPPGAAFSDNTPAEIRNLPVLRDAVEEQLGLRLVPTKGPVQYDSIDRIDRPTEN